MVVFFGPPGAGKSVQGQLLAARHGWRWLSTGQLLRDSHNLKLQEIMNRGELVSDEDIDHVIDAALEQARDIENIILDGFPRKIEQAKWLIDNLSRYNRQIGAVISLEVSAKELYSRLHIRGRLDDTPENIAKRTKDYGDKTKPVIDYLAEHGACVQEVDGEGTVGTVHDRVELALELCSQK